MTSEIPFLNYDNNQIFQNNNQNDIKNNDEKFIETNDNIDINNLNIKNNNNDLNDSIKLNNKSDFYQNELEWINYLKQSKINLEEINNLLLSNVG